MGETSCKQPLLDVWAHVEMGWRKERQIRHIAIIIMLLGGPAATVLIVIMRTMTFQSAREMGFLAK